MLSRSLIARLLPVGLVAAGLLAGCDRKSDAPAQPANATEAANATGAANVAAADEVAAPAPDEATAAPPRAADKLDRTHKGEAAPAVAFEQPDGKPVTLAAFRGKPVLVNLWATWCAPCVAELPTLGALAKSGRVRVVAVSQDSDPAKVGPFLAGKNVWLTPYRDPKLGLSLAYRANLPTTILFDAQGREVWRMTGGYEWDGADAAKLIAEAT